MTVGSPQSSLVGQQGARATRTEQFLEALRRHGSVWPTGGVEEFVIRHQLNDQGVDFSPDTRR
ncbi:hypothetical protein ACGF3G_44965 [Streptomyces sp. NPDC048179]|uniref:hypothetical protein n=1 Tax=Streptomyces sp. NPDC048179 TaxID=3365506 RepID=UPI00371638E5